MKTKFSIKEQLRRNTVALISLAVAVTSLGYNTWRNEASEHNRNQRLVTIQLLLMLGDLQQLTLDKQYGDNIDGDAVLREAWAKVLSIRDLAQIAEGDVPKSAMQLFDIWSDEYNNLGESKDSAQSVLAALEDVRRDTHNVLRSLD